MEVELKELFPAADDDTIASVLVGSTLDEAASKLIDMGFDIPQASPVHQFEAEYFEFEEEPLEFSKGKIDCPVCWSEKVEGITFPCTHSMCEVCFLLILIFVLTLSNCRLVSRNAETKILMELLPARIPIAAQ